MRKNVIKLGFIIGIAYIFIGCGGPLVTVGKLPPKQNKMTQVINCEYPSKASFQAELANNTNTFALQLAAESTLKNGYKYFSIELPKGAASNIYGSLVNTAADFIKTCNTNSSGKDLGASMLTLGLINFRIKDACHISNGASGKGAIRIISYKKQPINFASYNANAVLEYLKEEKLYTVVPEGELEEKML